MSPFLIEMTCSSFEMKIWKFFVVIWGTFCIGDAHICLFVRFVCVCVVLSLIANLFFIQFNPHTQAPVTICVILSSSIAASNKLCAVSYVDQIYDCIVSIMVPYHIIVFGISIHVNQFVKFYKQHMKVCAWLLARSPCLVCIALSNWTK